MIVIGLTGSSGSGKSTVSQILREDGFDIINCDRIAREVVLPGSPCLAAIADTFGKELIGADGALNRSMLAEIVFHDKKKLEVLNGIMYPQITADIKALLQQYQEGQSEFAVLDAPTLFESGANALCDTTVSVISNDSLRIKRIMQRDNIEEAMATGRLKSQYPNEFYIRRSDYIIRNIGTLAQLRTETQELIEKLRGRYGRRDYG